MTIRGFGLDLYLEGGKNSSGRGGPLLGKRCEVIWPKDRHGTNTHGLVPMAEVNTGRAEEK